tara:strand:- start:426 stop:1535 length:1110 start_codon:yes stop_codon:yes gene_type:complete
MKLFQSLLVAPATLGFLLPLSATANELNIADVSGYSSSEEILNISEFNPVKEFAVTNTRVDGLEARFNNFEASSFSETTTASFGVDMLLGAVDGATNEAATFNYQMGIDLETSFTGEDSLSTSIVIGNPSTPASGDDGLGFDSTGDVLTLDGLTYTFPVGEATVMVGDKADISSVYTGACSYSAFTDYMSKCGTGNSVGLEGNGATAAMSYAFNSGITLAGGISSTPTSLLTEEGSDIFGLEAAYSGDSYAVAVAYADAETTTYWGINGSYSFDFATVSAGVESADPDGSDSATGFMVGLSFAEVGPGSLDVGMGSTGNFTSADPEYYIYEASYAYPVNDGMTITPGVFIREQSGDNQTGIAVKTSFSF